MLDQASIDDYGNMLEEWGYMQEECGYLGKECVHMTHDICGSVCTHINWPMDFSVD